MRDRELVNALTTPASRIARIISIDSPAAGAVWLAVPVMGALADSNAPTSSTNALTWAGANKRVSAQSWGFHVLVHYVGLSSPIALQTNPQDVTEVHRRLSAGMRTGLSLRFDPWRVVNDHDASVTSTRSPNATTCDKENKGEGVCGLPCLEAGCPGGT
jgi:hypothetical protein